jgi:hypothetical protein
VGWALIMALVMRFQTSLARVTANGRTYSASGGIVDVPLADSLAIHSDQAQRMILMGATTDRPTYQPGVMNGGLPREMYDTSLGKMVFLASSGNPAIWVDSTGAVV